VETWTAPKAIEALDSHKPFDLVMLDHDLAEEHYLTLSEGMSEDRLPGQDEYAPGTGMDVAEHIAAMPVDKQPKLVIVHSYNPLRSVEMYNVLREAGVAVHKIPFNSMECPVRFP
jgi:CheY-like chemotaxis protein